MGCTHLQVVVLLRQQQIVPCTRSRMLGSLRQQQRAMLTKY
jgi:hypothetical protein